MDVGNADGRSAGRTGRDELAIGVVEFPDSDGIAIDGNRRGLVIVGERSVDCKVPKSVLRTSPDRHVTEDAAVTRHILIFEIAAVAPTVDLNRKHVLAFTIEMLGKVEFARQLGVLGISDLLAVKPDVISGVDTVEANDHLALLPRGRHHETSAIGGDGIVICLKRIAIEDLGEVLAIAHGIRLVRMRIPDVHVTGNAVAAHLDAGRNIDREPLGIVEALLPEILDAEIGITRPGELPIAVERLLKRSRGLQFIRKRSLDGIERHRIGSGGKTVNRIDLRILPGRKRGNGRSGCNQNVHYGTP